MRFTVILATSPMVDWGDGTIEPIVSTTPTHTYASSGDYTIKMSGISRFSIFGPDSSYHGKLLSVTDWGGIAWTNMTNMFGYANHFNLLPATAPNMSNVTSTFGMFHDASIFNQPLTSFNTANVTNMGAMFQSATAFNQSLASFNTANVTDMSNMFAFTTAFNQPLTSFNTANVTNMGAMFYSATAFNQSLANFNTANVTSMNSMFYGATAFNQSLASFNTTNVTNMFRMFFSASAFNQNVSNWCVTLIASKPSQFDLSGNAGFVGNTPIQPQWGTCL